MDIRDHGGPFGSGKYRKGSIINVDVNLNLLTTGGDITNTVTASELLNPSVRSFLLGDDGFIYVVSMSSSSPYPAYLTKLDTDFNIVTPSQPLPSVGTSGGILISRMDGYNLYIGTGNGRLWVFDIRDLSTPIWSYNTGSSSYDVTDMVLKDNYVYAAVSGNLASDSLVVFNKSNGNIVLQKVGLNTDTKTVAVDNDGYIYLGIQNSQIPGTRSVLFKMDISGNIIWENFLVTYSNSPPSTLFLDQKTNKLYGIFGGSSSKRVREINMTDGTIIREYFYVYDTAYGRPVFDDYGFMILPVRTDSSRPQSVTRMRMSDFTVDYEVSIATDFVLDIFLNDDKLYIGTNSKLGAVELVTTYELK